LAEKQKKSGAAKKPLSAERVENEGSGNVGENRLLPLKSDVIFRMVFGDSRNKSILRDFLTAVLNLPAEEYDEIDISSTPT
jgi:hypothetical protein